MTQKDKVKELVGRGLNSYHTKSLQQIDRIEKKNKEQNHKISILSNELDNDYLTKTEEGSVVSLEHSKEGMIYLDELQGNTLVNYCTDGSKEMTLNGDIDVEGTFVTTTEGVDNGKVDVMCEGSTLVNLVDLSRCTMYVSELKMCSYTIPEDLAWKEVGVSGRNVVEKLKPNTDYTVFMYIQENTVKNDSNFYMNMSATDRAFVTNPKIPTGYTGLIIRKLVTKEDFTGVTTALLPTIQNAKQGQKVTFKYMIIEGDLTNIENLEYFEGMKSVGQDDENGHKIEILSQTQNLVDDFSKYKKINSSVTFTKINNHSFSVEGNGEHTWQQVNFNIPFIQNAKAGDTFTLFAEEITLLNQDTSSDIGIQMRNTTLNMSISNSWQVNANKPIRNGLIKFTIPNNYNGTDILDLRVHINHNVALANKVTIKNLMIAKGHVDISSFKPYGLNKKEILMNEPLRKANDFYSDRLVKIGNKCYIERNTKEVVLDGTHNVVISGTSVKDETLCRFDFTINGLIKGSNGGEDKKFICDKLPYLFIHTLAGGSTNVAQECISNHSTNENSLNMVIKKSRLETIDVTGVNKWLSNNNIKIIIPIATPIYEPLEIEPSLNTYNDVTHISNNSIIPCNMKIQNTGYNAIIKPSTLYTIALDTNKSGTIGMNLGGTKGTTTNNVLTLTTPATLTDDSLRLHGKGIKGSKVRLLEGDKTNWIPSHFEGIKSSFEDKLQDDGTYKMEILSNNKNILNLNKHDGVTTHTHHGVTFTYNDKTQEFTVNGTATQDLGYQPLLCSKDRFLTFEQGKQYTLSTTTPIPFFVQISEKNVMSALTLHPNTMFRNVFDRQNTNYCSTKMNYFMIWGINAGDTFNNLKFKLQIEEGSVKTEYIPNNYNKIQFSSIEPLRKWDRFVFKDGQLMIERGSKVITFNGSEPWAFNNTDGTTTNRYFLSNAFLGGTEGQDIGNTLCDKLQTYQWSQTVILGISRNHTSAFVYNKNITNTKDFKEWLSENNLIIVYKLAEPIYEEIPFELQKIILEGYENGTLFFDTNIPPTSTITYAGETPIVKSVKLNKTEVLNNTNDINDNIVPYLMDMDYRVVCLQLQSENINDGVSMARLFGGAYEMLQRDIQSKRYSIDEYRYRLDAYLGANKITEDEYNKLGDMLNE